MVLRSIFCATCALFLLSPGYAAEKEKASPKAEAPLALKKSAKLLNVVYFLGSDTEPVPDYERRLSELLLHLQQFYGKEMARNGYGPRSFGLDMKSPGSVNIIVYKAKKPASNYPYEDGGGHRALVEMEEYFKAHPGMKRSDHTLFIMPTWKDDKNSDLSPGGVPFYGMGRNCFALDYPAFELKHLGQKTKEGQLLTKWYGGMAHELGHGLNLPHNHATTTDTQKLGTALMGGGNYTFGSSPTFLTPASSALLDACEVFSFNPKKEFYKGDSAVRLKDFSISFADKGEKISLSGSYSCKQAVRALNVYFQDPPYAVNQDYDAVSFSYPLGKKSGRFSAKIDKKELYGLTNNTFQIELMFVLDSGQQFHKKVVFKWDDLKDYKEKSE